MEVILALFVVALIGILSLAFRELQKKQHEIADLEHDRYLLRDCIYCTLNKDPGHDPRPNMREVLRRVGSIGASPSTHEHGAGLPYTPNSTLCPECGNQAHLMERGMAGDNSATYRAYECARCGWSKLV